MKERKVYFFDAVDYADALSVKHICTVKREKFPADYYITGTINYGFPVIFFQNDYGANKRILVYAESLSSALSLIKKRVLE